MATTSTVVLVGEAADAYECLKEGAASGHFAMRRFVSAPEVLEFSNPQMTGCFVLEQRVRGASGLTLQEQLRAKGCQQPFIYVLEDGDVATAVEAMQQGALDCLERPLDGARLRRDVEQAIVRDARCHLSQAERAVVLARFETLTCRERQILEYVAAGEITKSIARLLGISPKTVEVHRSNIMKKMRVESAAGLLHLVAKHAICPLGAARADGQTALL